MIIRKTRVHLWLFRKNLDTWLLGKRESTLDKFLEHFYGYPTTLLSSTPLSRAMRPFWISKEFWHQKIHKYPLVQTKLLDLILLFIFLLILCNIPPSGNSRFDLLFLMRDMKKCKVKKIFALVDMWGLYLWPNHPLR